MTVLLWGLGLFALSFLLHLLWWHLPRLPRNRLVLTAIFLATLAGALGLVWLLGRAGAVPGWAVPRGFGQHLFVVVLHLSLFVAYLGLYSGLEGDSPTLVMILRVAAAGEEGLPEEELAAFMGDDRFLRSRLSYLVADGMGTLQDGRYRMAEQGRGLLGFYRTYARLAGLRGKTV
jgi:hypothetical protein